MPEAALAVPLLCLAFFLCLGGLARLSWIMSAAWGAVYAATALWLALTVPQSLRLLLRVWPLLILPCLALLSVLWSLSPVETAVKGVQFTFTTVLAIRIASVLSPRTTLLCLLGAAAAGTALSLAMLIFLPRQAFEANGAFRGIFTQKTSAGIALTLFALGTASLASLRRRPMVGVAGFLVVIPLIVMTNSISAIVMLGGLGPILVFGVFRHSQPVARLGTILFVVITTSLVIGAIYASGLDPMAAGLALAGKTPTLTGRTDIWAVGWDVAERFPILGVGYAGFWGNPAFAADWGFLHATVEPRLKGFHNTYLEALVTTGPTGLAAVIIVYYWTLWRSFAWFLAFGKSEALFWFVVVLAAIALSFTDNALYGEHELFHFYLTLVFVHCSVLHPRPVFRLSPPAPRMNIVES